MEKKQIRSIIDFHKSGLEQYRHLMSPSAQLLEAQTIAALEELEKIYIQPDYKWKATDKVELVVEPVVESQTENTTSTYHKLGLH